MPLFCLLQSASSSFFFFFFFSSLRPREGRGRGARVIMTCQIRSDGTCSECKHNSECSDDIFQAVFLLGEISGVTAQPESHGSQLHNGEYQHTHAHRHTKRDRERRNYWHF